MSKILVIDDNQLFLEGLLELLEYQGFQAIGALNGSWGWQLAQETSPDLITCDLEIRNFSIYELLSRVRKTPLIERIPVMVIAAERTESYREKILSLGASDYLTKPFLVERFLQGIHTLLEETEIPVKIKQI